MLSALREGEQPGMAGVPAREQLHCRIEQALRDGPVPVLRGDGQGPEETDTAPVGGEIRSDQTAIEFCGEPAARVRLPPGPDTIRVTRELFRFGHPEERAERHPENPVSLVQILLGERPDTHPGGIAHVRFSNPRTGHSPPACYNSSPSSPPSHAAS